MNSTVRRLAEKSGMLLHYGDIVMGADEECLEAFARALLEMAARECEDNEVQDHARLGHSLVPSQHRVSEYHHAGLTYAEAIRALLDK